MLTPLISAAWVPHLSFLTCPKLSDVCGMMSLEVQWAIPGTRPKSAPRQSNIAGWNDPHLVLGCFRQPCLMTLQHKQIPRFSAMLFIMYLINEWPEDIWSPHYAHVVSEIMIPSSCHYRRTIISRPKDILWYNSSGWWLSFNPSEKYEFVNWRDDSQYMEK